MWISAAMWKRPGQGSPSEGILTIMRERAGRSGTCHCTRRILLIAVGSWRSRAGNPEGDPWSLRISLLSERRKARHSALGVGMGGDQEPKIQKMPSQETRAASTEDKALDCRVQTSPSGAALRLTSGGEAEAQGAESFGLQPPGFSL